MMPLPGETATRQILRLLYRAAGAGLAIALMEVLARVAAEPLARVPFVTSIVLAFGLPDNDASRPYAIVAGHLLSSLAGFAVLYLLGPGEISAALAVGLGTFLMLRARAMHPPAGIDAFIVAGSGVSVSWIASPVLIGAVLLAIASWSWAQAESRLLS